MAGKRIPMSDDDLIVSKTDVGGRITYVNQTFSRVAGYSYEEVIGKPHSIVRHPDMPKSVFWLLWQTIQAGKEIFAYVINKTKNDDYYWVFAHVTPTFNTYGQIVGYHSNRRNVEEKAIEVITPIYKELINIEKQHSRTQEGIRHAVDKLTEILQGKSYEEVVLSL